MSDYITHISIFSTLVPILSAILFRKFFNPVLKILFAYVLLSFSTDLLVWHSTRCSVANILINTYTYLEFTCVLAVYYLTWPKTRLSTLIFATVFGAFTVFFLLFLFVFHQYDQINLYSAVEAATFIFASILCFGKMLNSIKIPALTDYPLFWINTAFLTYFSTAFFVFLFANEHFNPNAARHVKPLWIIHNTIHILYNCLLAAGILKWKKAE